MRKTISFILCQFLLFSIGAQEVPIGQFKDYLAYNKFHSIAQDSENIYAATSHSILVVDKNDHSLVKWSKINGLSEVGIQHIHSDQEGRLFIAYKNSNIDIVQNLKLNNIRDILNKQISGSKTINHIFTKEDLAYFSCDFGVVILDLKTLLVKDSWFTIKNNETYILNCFAIHNNRYYLATNKGVFSLPVSASNPADFSMWDQENELSKSKYKLLCSFQDKLFAVYDGREVTADSLFVYKDGEWKFDDNSLVIPRIRSFDVKNDRLLICGWNQVRVFFENKTTKYYWEPTPPISWQNGSKALFDEKMNIWVADNYSGLVHINAETSKYETIIGDGPANNYAYSLYFNQGILAVVPGARSSNIVPNWTTASISTLQDDKWWSHANFSEHSRARGLNSIAINPLNTNEIYMGSWLGGLLKINKSTLETVLYDSFNSPLITGRFGVDSVIFIAGLAIDNLNRLWISQTQVRDLIKIKDLNEENKWYSLNLRPLIESSDGVLDGHIVEHIFIDSRNYKWITLPGQNRLIVFSENGGTIDNTAVHKKRSINLVDQANIPAKRITCIAEDRDGNIWTGSDQGIKVIYNADAVFSSQLYAKNILLEQNGYVHNLFEFEYVTCIAVDAANRKWVGTQNAGVFLISPTGTQELLHFTSDNSPLFSNTINDIKINPENGEVFIATNEGLMSYKGTATIGKETYKEVLVYPNPVREDYYGPIAVKGLMEDSFCKITDATGNLVWQGYAYGGQLIWNGKDFNGKRPATGVYFVMASSKTGKARKVAKFLFIQ